MEKICFIINSQKKGFNALKREVSAIFSGSYSIAFLLTDGHRSAEKLARISAEEGCRIIVAVGGDGTVNEVINGVMHSGANCDNVKVGVLPWGTGNDFARSIGIDGCVKTLFGYIQENRYSRIDVISVGYVGFDGEPASRFFNNIGDVGIGPDTVMTVNRIHRWFGAKLAFSIAAVKALFFLKPKQIYLEADNFTFSGRVRCVCMANGTYFGSGMGIAPNACLDNGLVNLVVIEDVTAWDFIRLSHLLRKAAPISHPKVRYVDTSTVRIKASVNDLPLELDGEVVGFAPIYATAIPSCIAVYGACFSKVPAAEKADVMIAAEER